MKLFFQKKLTRKKSQEKHNINITPSILFSQKLFSKKFQVGRKLQLKLIQKTEIQKRNCNKPLPWFYFGFYWKKSFSISYALKHKQSFGA